MGERRKEIEREKGGGGGRSVNNYIFYKQNFTPS